MNLRKDKKHKVHDSDDSYIERVEYQSDKSYNVSHGDKSNTTYLHNMFIDASSIDVYMRSEDLYCLFTMYIENKRDYLFPQK